MMVNSYFDCSYERAQEIKYRGDFEGKFLDTPKVRHLREVASTVGNE